MTDQASKAEQRQREEHHFVASPENEFCGYCAGPEWLSTHIVDEAPDERFPNRPDTPDFWRLSRVLRKLDKIVDTSISDAEREAAYEATIAENGITADVLSYVAVQRALRLTGGAGSTKLAAAWVDGFIAGAEYAKSEA